MFDERMFYTHSNGGLLTTSHCAFVDGTKLDVVNHQKETMEKKKEAYKMIPLPFLSIGHKRCGFPFFPSSQRKVVVTEEI